MQLVSYRNTERSARFVTKPALSEADVLAARVAGLERRKTELGEELMTMVRAREKEVQRLACEREMAEAEMARIREQHREDFGREVAEYERKRQEMAIEIATLGSELKLKEIAERICEVTGVSFTDLRSHRRSTALIFARQAFYYWACRLTEKSKPQIGRFLDRDHTTVLHGRDKYEERHMQDGSSKDEMAERIAERVTA